METTQESSASKPRLDWRRRLPSWTAATEGAVFLAFTVFFLFYGQTPWTGGAGLGLVGADEPRYAQIAHEMLDRFDAAPPLVKLSDCIHWQGSLSGAVTWSGCQRYFNSLGPALRRKLAACVTPYLYGQPWLEKPALYYWRAMFVFQDFGVHDWVARLPSASFAFVMVVLIYLHMRRFRPGGHLDAALITVACAGIMG
ncbi:MAG: glycosyltransferase family 39 protein, partial [Terracidiphilus sp.]